VLSLILDFSLAYLITRKIENIWFLIFLAIVAGLVSATAVNIIAYTVSNGAASVGEVVLRFSLGLIFHPVITLFCALVLSKPVPTSSKTPENEAMHSSSVATESDEITEYVNFLNTSLSDTEIRLRTAELLQSGYDSESLLDLVREKGGIECVVLVERAIKAYA